MGYVEIRPAGMVDNFLPGGGALSFKEYLESLEEKRPEALNPFERELLALSQRAKREGTKFCAERFKDEARAFYDRNRTFVIVGAVIVFILLFTRIF